MAALTSKSRSEYRNLFLWQGHRQEQGEEMDKKRERSLQVQDEGEQGLGAHASPNPCPAGDTELIPRLGWPRGSTERRNPWNPTHALVSWHTHPPLKHPHRATSPPLTSRDPTFMAEPGTVRGMVRLRSDSSEARICLTVGCCLNCSP